MEPARLDKGLTADGGWDPAAETHSRDPDAVAERSPAGKPGAPGDTGGAKDGETDARYNSCRLRRPEV